MTQKEEVMAIVATAKEALDSVPVIKLQRLVIAARSRETRRDNTLDMNAWKHLDRLVNALNDAIREVDVLCP
jgi:hypothetical protein